MNSAMKLWTSDLPHVYNETLLELGAIKKLSDMVALSPGGDSYNQT